jgi:OOP family OmpA-OmpF porin
MASMLENVEELVTPMVLSRLTGQTGESESAVAKGLGAAIPAMLGAVANRSDDHGFFESLADLAVRTAAEPDPFRGAALASSGSGIDTTSAIGGWLSNLFGQHLAGLTDAIARYSGIRGSSATSLLATCATLVLGYLGRLVKTDYPSATSLAERLRSERPPLASALLELPRRTRAPVETRYAHETTRRIAAAQAAAWSIPIMLLLGTLGIGGLIWWAAASRHEDVARARVGDAVSDAVGTTGTISGRLARPLPGNIMLRIPAGGTEDRLSRYLASVPSGSMTMNFDRIGFDTGSASLTPSSREQINNVAAILRAYPRTSVTVAGYADNVGEEQPNLALSHARAHTVARALTEAGVAAERVSAEGFAPRTPVGDNSTEAGRSQNRRVALEVAVK